MHTHAKGREINNRGTGQGSIVTRGPHPKAIKKRVKQQKDISAKPSVWEIGGGFCSNVSGRTRGSQGEDEFGENVGPIPRRI